MRLFTSSTSKRLNEVTGFLFLAFGLVILLGLASFHVTDPSWDTASGPVKTLNLTGRIGAHAADLLLQSFGIGAFLFPLLIFALGWKWMRSEDIQAPLVKLFGALLLFASFCAAAGLAPDVRVFEHSIPLGGMAGIVLSEMLKNELNLAGALIATATGMIVAVYLVSAFTISKLDFLFEYPARWIAILAGRWKDWREARDREREARRQEQILRRREARKQTVSERPGPATVEPDTVPAALFSELQAPPVTGEKTPRRKKTPTVVTETMPWETSPGTFAGAAEHPVAEDEIPICQLEDLPAPENDPLPAPVAQRTTAAPKLHPIYRLPSTEILNEPQARTAFDEQELKTTAAAVKTKFEEFNVLGNVVQINPGPVVTTFEFKPEAGIKYSRITALREDLCLGLQAESILIERIPGKPTVGIEVPNSKREVIALRQILESEEFTNSTSYLTVSLGKDINGRIKVASLETMPHLLIAGSTGSGKSVMINSLVMSVLYKATPDDVRMILVDPKRVELGMYEGIPHLLTPVITDPRKATNALKNAVLEMERRLRLLAEHGARNIDQFNRKVRKMQEQPRSLFVEDVNEEELKPMPYILILIDELADLMMLEGKNVEESVTRLAQMARAAGMHLVLATQRPSVDVITGLIKANFPARISFRVATRVDSRTILDIMGAEHLLGKGDMLFLPPGSSRLTRVHGAFVTEPEIMGVVDFWKAQAKPEYDQSYLIAPAEDSEVDPDEPMGEQDPMYEEALRVVLEMGKASTSTLQRRLRLGYGRAARILDMMHRDGIIGPPDGSKPREVLKRPDWIRETEDSLL
jgi:S-DNA-T family DNA segregation ATPase FtsK/SpoIIIE